MARVAHPNAVNNQTTGNSNEFLSLIANKGFRAPDATMVSVVGLATVAAQYKDTRTLFFTDWPSDEIIQQLTDKGWACINASG